MKTGNYVPMLKPIKRLDKAIRNTKTIGKIVPLSTSYHLLKIMYKYKGNALARDNIVDMLRAKDALGAGLLRPAANRIIKIASNQGYIDEVQVTMNSGCGAPNFGVLGYSISSKGENAFIEVSDRMDAHNIAAAHAGSLLSANNLLPENTMT